MSSSEMGAAVANQNRLMLVNDLVETLHQLDHDEALLAASDQRTPLTDFQLTCARTTIHAALLQEQLHAEQIAERPVPGGALIEDAELETAVSSLNRLRNGDAIHPHNREGFARDVEAVLSKVARGGAIRGR